MTHASEPGAFRVGIVGAGTIAAVHCAALANVIHLYPGLALKPRVVAVADINHALAERLAARFGIDRVAADWSELVSSEDVDLVVACLPPAANRDVVLAAAAAGKHVVCEKPLGISTAEAAEMLEACRRAGVFHGIAAGYRWSPAVREIRTLIESGELGEIRSMRASFMLDYGADPATPLLWRFRKSLSGGGIAIDTGYHLVDCARYLVGEIVAIQGLTRTFITERPLPASDAIGNRGAGATLGASAAGMGQVDVEDAAAALVTFESGAYGVFETSRVAIGRKVALRLDVFGSRGSAGWDLERADEFEVCLPGDAGTFGFRRVLVNPTHPGAAELLIGGADGTSMGWLGQECAMWGEFLAAIAEGRRAHADFTDGVRDNAVIEALYRAAETGDRTPVIVPAGL